MHTAQVIQITPGKYAACVPHPTKDRHIIYLRTDRAVEVPTRDGLRPLYKTRGAAEEACVTYEKRFGRGGRRDNPAWLIPAAQLLVSLTGLGASALELRDVFWPKKDVAGT